MMNMGSVDLIVYQEGNRSIPYCQGGRDEQVNLDQLEELTKQMRLSEGLINSGMEVDKQEKLIEVEDQDNLMMIGGIEIFLSLAREEAKICVAGATTVEEQSQLTMTVRKEEELEQTLEAAQAEADEEENERSEEWLNNFSQGAEKKEVVALKLAAKEAKEKASRFITSWEMELEMLEDWLNNPGPTRELTEDELSVKVTEQQVNQRETAELKSTAVWQLGAIDKDEEEGGMGDHDDLLMCRKFLQLRRLHEQSQPLEQLDEVIEEIKRLMLGSVETSSEERLS
jgi:hypothetical protein